MPLIIPSEARGRSWDRTPKSTIETRRYEVLEGPRLDGARAVQREAFDWALGMLERHPYLKVRAKGDSLWSRLTRARAQGNLPRATVNLQRAAVAQAHQAFALREEHLAAQVERALGEQDEDITPRTLRRLTRAPKAPETYLRCHPSKQGRKQAVALLEGARAAPDGRTVKVQGVGTFVLRDEVTKPIRSCQLVERRGKVWLHAQHGETVPEPKGLGGPQVGLDSGVTHTLTSSGGTHWERPNTTALQARARSMEKHRAKCCTRGSRQWKRLGRKARGLRRRIAGIQRNWECHVAKELSTAHSVVGLENLELANMTASGKGTQSLPGSRAKKGLNERLARARLAKLHHAIHRRCIRDGTWAVAVNPRNSSTTCARCGHRDKASRKGEQFECTKCGHRAHADQNAGDNVRSRAVNVLVGYHRARGARESCPGDPPVLDRQGFQGNPARDGTSRRGAWESQGARPSSRTGIRPGMTDVTH